MPSVTHTVLLRILTPLWKILDFIFSKLETVTALNAIRGRLDVAHFFTLLGLPRTGRRIFGRFHVGATLWAAEIVQRSLAWCSCEGDVYTSRQIRAPSGDGIGGRVQTLCTQTHGRHTHGGRYTTTFSAYPLRWRRVLRTIIAPKRLISSRSTKSSESPPRLTVSNRAIWLLLVQDHPQDCILGVHKFISFL